MKIRTQTYGGNPWFICEWKENLRISVSFTSRCQDFPARPSASRASRQLNTREGIHHWMNRSRMRTSPSCPILPTAAMHHTPFLHAVAPRLSRRPPEGPLAYRNADSSPAPDNEAGRRITPLICNTYIRPHDTLRCTTRAGWAEHASRPPQVHKPVTGEPSGPPASHILTQCNPADR